MGNAELIEPGRIDFLIIGAAKSATTWLQKSLQLDPRIAMPNPELHYFSRAYEKGHDWYLHQFPQRGGALAVGEKSNSYLDTPEAAGRIHAALPAVKLVVQLRNPVQRAYSDYCMLLRRGEVTRDVDLYLDPRRSACERFLASGRYGEHLTRFLRLFGEDQILVTLAEDVTVDPSGLVAAVTRHIGLEPEGAQAVASPVKDSRTPVLAPGLRRLLAPLKPAVAPLRHTAPFRAARSLAARPMRYPPIREELSARLAEFYRKDVEVVAALVGRDLAHWLEPARQEAA